MADDKKKKPEPIPAAKRHKLLGIIDGELRGAHTKDTFEVLGHKYVLRTLDPVEEAWADSYVNGENFYQTARNRRAPYVAAALKAIDDTPVEELFTPPDDLPEMQRELIDSSEEFRATWLRDEVLKWLVSKDKHGPYVQMLYHCYLEVDTKRGEAFDNLDPLSKSRRTGGQSNTSSPEKESSSPTQASGG
jgi:hypothetical protein